MIPFGSRRASVSASTWSVHSANPPLQSLFYPGQRFRDTLQHQTVTGLPRGIGAINTADFTFHTNTDSGDT